AALRLAERWRLRPLRRRAVARAERWIRQRLPASDGLGAIFPPILNTILAFRALGYAVDDPVIADQLRELERLELGDGEALWVQPCFSAVWDTALAVNALVESGVPRDDGRLRRAARWLAAREARRPGDWRVKCPRAEPSGWYFEYANEFYPDCDDTAQVVTSLAKIEPAGAEAAEHGAQRGRAVRWLLAMQSGSGGWASFDKDCDRQVLTHIPFADHNAMIDPPTVDVTARVLEALACAGVDPSAPAIRRAVDFVLGQQEADGSWYGRWGCNYLYGTWLALVGLERVGEDTRRSAWGARARGWLERCQNGDGGWGELPASYSDRRRKGEGPSTASQTAWAVLGLLAAGDRSGAVERGVRHLLAGQRADGAWQDEFWTGTGFPEVFYLRYHLYATYFPLLALARWRRDQEAAGGASPKLSA
ncbi:MAG: squalene--hopene cyclase, partial [Thermoanaerobaculia bacterium]